MSRPNPLDYLNEDEYNEDVFAYESGPSTMAEMDYADAVARSEGRDDQQWILSDRDVWYKNPRYRGPDQPHPEYPED